MQNLDKICHKLWQFA